MNEQDGGAAFPRFQREHIYRDAYDRSGEEQFIPKDGMSLRDYFAGQALAGIIAAYTGVDLPLPDDDTAAARAYSYADSMLTKRESQK